MKGPGKKLALTGIRRCRKKIRAAGDYEGREDIKEVLEKLDDLEEKVRNGSTAEVLDAVKELDRIGSNL